MPSNDGAAGIEGVSLVMIEQRGAGRFLAEVRDEAPVGALQPQPVRRVWIPKPEGRQRPLGIPMVKDRVVQMATKLVIEPVFEADFLECSCGFRLKRSAADALEKLRIEGARGRYFVVDGDIQSFFGTSDDSVLMGLAGRRICDGRVQKLIRRWLDEGVMEEGNVRHEATGTPQGGVISPLLANIYLHELDREWQCDCQHLGVLVRCADGFVVLCKSESQANAAMRWLHEIFARLKLTLHPEKTNLVQAGLAKDGSDLLDCHLRIMKWCFKGCTSRACSASGVAFTAIGSLGECRSNGVRGRWRSCALATCTAWPAPSHNQGARRHELDPRSAVCGKAARTVGTGDWVH